jgi:hypothetical protein
MQGGNPCVLSFTVPNPFSRIVALGLALPLTEISTMNRTEAAWRIRLAITPPPGS